MSDAKDPAAPVASSQSGESRVCALLQLGPALASTLCRTNVPPFNSFMACQDARRSGNM